MLTEMTPGISDRRTLTDSQLMWALGLLVISARLAVFAYAGSPLPYYDQWLLEFNNTYLLAQHGDSWFEILFRRQNEHWVVTTRLLSLMGFGINGYWDVKFLVVIAAILRACEAMLAFRILSMGRGQIAHWMIWVGCVVVFAAPVSGYNLLCGMQVCFFLAHAAALWSILSVVTWDRPVVGATRLVIGTGIGVFSLGAGIAIPVATLLMHLAQRKPRAGFWWGWFASALIAGCAVLSVAHRGRLADTSVALPEQVEFLLRIVSWPIMHPGIGSILVVSILVWAIRHLSATDPIDDGLACTIGIGVFAATNAAMLALERASADLHMRHWDTLSLGALALLSMFVALADTARTLRLPRFVFAGLWGAICVVALGLQIARHTWPYIREAHDGRDTTVAYYRELLLTGKIGETAVQLYADLPEYGHRFFDDPIGRYVPHPVATHNILINPVLALALLAPEIIPAREKSAASRVTDRVINFAWVPGVLGLALVGWAAARRTRETQSVETRS